MMKRLQSFDFRRSPYQRAADNWVCGYLAEGRACRLGPTAGGRCQTRSECDPKFAEGEWVCTRPEDQGGVCSEGPRPDGSCCQQRPPCVPQPSLRRRRGRVTFWATALTLAITAFALGSQQRDLVFDPGPVIKGHGEVGDCATCHVAHEGGPGNWVTAAFRRDDPHGDSEKCVKCHDRGKNPTHPHNLSPAAMESHTKQIKANTPEWSPNWMVSLRDQVFTLPGEAKDALACATCHKEHLGAQFDPTQVADDRCQTCHAVKFESFAEGHPPFDRYPYLRRTRLAFDHKRHFDRNFAEAKVQNPPKTCADCHLPDPSGRYMVVKSFDETCANCHTKDIRGEGLAGTKGLSVFALPALDLETLQEKGIDIGEWPQDAVTETLPPFMTLMLSDSAELAADLRVVEGVELPELSEASPEQLAAVERVAWGIKELLHDIVVTGAETVHGRVEDSLNRKLDRDTVTQLIAQIPLDVLRSAQRDWFPRLGEEIEQRRQKKAALEADRPQRTRFSLRRFEPAPALRQPAAARPAEAFRPGPDHRPRWLQLAQAADDLLNAQDDLLDKESLRLEDFELLKQEDAAGGDGGLGKLAPSGGNAAPAPAPAQAEKAPEPEPAKAPEPEVADAPAEPAPAPAAPAAPQPEPRVAQGSDGLLTGTEGLIDEKSLRLEDLEQLLKEDAEGGDAGFGAIAPSEIAAPEKAPAPAVADKAPEPAAPATPAAAPEPDEPEEPAVAEYEPLVPAVDPETWARFGGWFRQDFGLYYRPVTHQDPFMHAWIGLAAKAQGTRADAQGKALLAVFRDKNTPGKCLRCHSQDKRDVRGMAVNWKPFFPAQGARPFTIFNHAFHFSLVGTKGCATCHEIDTAADFAGGFKDLDPQTFQSNFAPMKAEVCADCHVAESAGEACVQCHRFHVGEFPIIPVRTLVAGMTGPGATPAAADAAAAPGGANGGLGLLSEPARPQVPAEAPAPQIVVEPPSVAAEPPQTGAETPKPEVALPPRPPARKLRPQNAAAAAAPRSFLLHLSSHRTMQSAESARARVLSSFADILVDRDLYVDRQDQGDRGAFFRLMAASFPDRGDAENTCRALQARSQDCRVLR